MPVARPRCRHAPKKRAAATLVRGIRAWSEAPWGVSGPIVGQCIRSMHAKSASRHAKRWFTLPMHADLGR